MSVRQSLLAILDQGECYGYQLRAEYARRTGAPAPNVGQIYTTLERLERDGLVVRSGADERGHQHWRITAAGHEDAARWLTSPDARATRDDLVHKIALAATLPGVDVAKVIADQLGAAHVRLAEAETAVQHFEAGGAVTARIVAASERARARADVEWLEGAAHLVGRDPSERAFALSSERPRRGRPSADPAAQAG